MQSGNQMFPVIGPSVASCWLDQVITPPTIFSFGGNHSLFFIVHYCRHHIETIQIQYQDSTLKDNTVLLKPIKGYNETNVKKNLCIENDMGQ